MRSPLAFFKPTCMFICTAYGFYMIIHPGNQVSQTHSYIVFPLKLILPSLAPPRSHQDVNLIPAEAEGCPPAPLTPTSERQLSDSAGSDSSLRVEASLVQFCLPRI